MSLLADIRETTVVPAIGTGGVMSGRDASAVLGAGAIAVQLGTAFLCAPEAGTSSPYRQALLEGTFADTIIDRAPTAAASPAGWRSGGGSRRAAGGTTGRPPSEDDTRNHPVI